MSKLVLKCCTCPNQLPNNSTLAKKFCNDCNNIRDKESQNRKNQSRATKREYTRIKINIVKSWIIWSSLNNQSDIKKPENLPVDTIEDDE